MTSQACESIQLELPAYVRGLLEELAAGSVEHHVRGCPRCQRELDELRQLEEILIEHLPAIAPSSTFASTLANRLAAEGMVEEEQRGTGWFGWRLRPWLIPLAVAATLTAVVLSSTLTTPTGPASVASLQSPSVERGTAVDTARPRPEVASRHGAQPEQVADSRLEAPPAELLERPDLFVDYSVIQQLDFLETAGKAG